MGTRIHGEAQLRMPSTCRVESARGRAVDPGGIGETAPKGHCVHFLDRIKSSRPYTIGRYGTDARPKYEPPTNYAKGRNRLCR